MLSRFIRRTLGRDCRNSLKHEPNASLTRSPGYTFEGLSKISAPTLILTGDRDVVCSAEEGVAAYRMLQEGELAILPNHGHYISSAAVQAAIEFLERHQLAYQPAPASG